MQLQRPILNHYGMTRIHAALVPNDYMSRPAQEVSDLPFSFVAPLGTNYYDVSQCLKVFRSHK